MSRGCISRNLPEPADGSKTVGLSSLPAPICPNPSHIPLTTSGEV